MNDHLFFGSMRIKDEFKQEAVIKATIKLVNEIGFAASSVSKIAKEASVSPATIYIYYKNKEDLLVSTYVEIKKKIGQVALKNFNNELPIRDILKMVWFNLFKYLQKNTDMFQFTEQFSNSPYTDLVKSEDVEKHFEPLFSILQKGIDQKIIKNVHIDILAAFIFFPIITLSNNKLCKSFRNTDRAIEEVFTLAWDAIKL